MGNTSYSDSGLFGVYGVTKPDQAGALATAVSKALSGLVEVGKDELAGAKAMLKGKVLREMDDDASLMQSIGQQLLLTGAYGSGADFCKLIDAVTQDEVTAAAKAILSSKPTVAAFGDTHKVPHYS